MFVIIRFSIVRIVFSSRCFQFDFSALFIRFLFLYLQNSSPFPQCKSSSFVLSERFRAYSCHLRVCCRAQKTPLQGNRWFELRPLHDDLDDSFVVCRVWHFVTYIYSKGLLAFCWIFSQVGFWLVVYSHYHTNFVLCTCQVHFSFFFFCFFALPIRKVGIPRQFCSTVGSSTYRQFPRLLFGLDGTYATLSTNRS